MPVWHSASPHQRNRKCRTNACLHSRLRPRRHGPTRGPGGRQALAGATGPVSNNFDGSFWAGPHQTDASGIVTLVLSPDWPDIGVTKIGYEPAITRIEVGQAGRTVRLVLTQTPAQAQAPAKQDEVVASTLSGRRMEDQAIPVEVLGRERIEARMLMSPGDIAMLLNEMPGLRVQTTTPVLGTSIVRIHGLPGRYTRLLSDGTPLFGDRPGGYALLRIPPMDLNRVEVIKGAASAFYGSDALAGAVNLLSRQPGSQPSREFLFSQSAPTQRMACCGSRRRQPVRPVVEQHA